MYKSILTCLFAAFFTMPNAHANALDWASGAWGVDLENLPEDADAKELNRFEGCANSPLIISVDKELKTYEAVHTGQDNFKATSPILSVNTLWISLQYDDETRTMKNGELQIWHMFFVSPDKFYWIVGPGIHEGERDGIVPIARVRCKNFT